MDIPTRYQLGLMTRREHFYVVSRSESLQRQTLIIGLKALPYIDLHYPLPFEGREHRSVELIALAIKGLTGIHHSPKQVLSHIEVIKQLTNDPHNQYGFGTPSGQAHGGVDGLVSDYPVSMDFPATTSFQTLLLQNPRIDLGANQILSVRRKDPVCKDQLTLTLVSRQIRAEALRFLDSHLAVSLHDDIEALMCFQKLINAEHEARVKYVHLDFLEGRDKFSSVPSSELTKVLTSLLPNLKLLHITLEPRLPERLQRPKPPWGPESISFLSTLSEMTVKVRLSLRWKEDCKYFEEEYAKPQGWTRVPEAEARQEAEFRAAT